VVIIGLKIISYILYLFYILTIIGILAIGIYQLIKKWWKKGIINLILFLCSLLISFVIIVALSIVMMFFSPSEDGFGKNIKIPADMVLEEPLKESSIVEKPEQDSDGAELIDIFSKASELPDRTFVSVDLAELNEFSGPKRDVLIRHLATSAKWFLTQERGKQYAYRRCVVGGRWQNSLHGYYSAHNFDPWGNSRFQFRILIGIDGPVMSGPWKSKITYASIGADPILLKVVEDKKFNQGIESYLVLHSDGAALEIFEQSQYISHPFTPFALSRVKVELSAVLESNKTEKQGFDQSLMPSASIKEGDPTIFLVNGMQGGIYFVYAYVNPGEPGCVYLKVFEATKNTPLSTHRIRGRSTEYIGWSNNSREQFYYNTEITVYEGDWGTYYPARFELWFVPDSGKPERKLIEKIFKIEGWQR